MWVWFLGQEDSLEKEMETHYSIFAWRIPWMEEPDRVQSMGSQRVGHNLGTEHNAKSLRYLKTWVNHKKKISVSGKGCRRAWRPLLLNILLNRVEFHPCGIPHQHHQRLLPHCNCLFACLDPLLAYSIHSKNICWMNEWMAGGRMTFQDPWLANCKVLQPLYHISLWKQNQLSWSHSRGCRADLLKRSYLKTCDAYWMEGRESMEGLAGKSVIQRWGWEDRKWNTEGWGREFNRKFLWGPRGGFMVRNFI